MHEAQFSGKGHNRGTFCGTPTNMFGIRITIRNLVKKLYEDINSLPYSRRLIQWITQCVDGY